MRSWDPFMIDVDRFELIKRKHGAYGSWAIWAPATGSPKSNMGDLTVLDQKANPALLHTLNPDVVMVGLNVSRYCPDESFGNFHDPSPVANDFKIRFAFRDTEFWGAYMTDALKEFVELESGQVLRYLKKNPRAIDRHVEMLRTELSDLGTSRPVILAFGGATHALLRDNLAEEDYSLLVRLTHYSHYISKEKYRDTVHEQILHASG